MGNISLDFSGPVMKDLSRDFDAGLNWLQHKNRTLNGTHQFSRSKSTVLCHNYTPRQLIYSSAKPFFVSLNPRKVKGFKSNRKLAAWELYAIYIKSMKVTTVIGHNHNCPVITQRCLIKNQRKFAPNLQLETPFNCKVYMHKPTPIY